MTKGRGFKIVFEFMAVGLVCFMLAPRVLADTVESDTYRIEGLTVETSGGENLQSSTYGVMLSVGDVANDYRFESASYRIGSGTGYVYMANVPVISCFETTTDGSTLCGDASVTPDGMVMLCGGGGCYNRARFEIDTQNNPSDTLYSVQITTDSGWASWNYVDGATKMLEAPVNHNISDYLSETSWETPDLNILGLTPGTTYYLRATALQGDFTESGPSAAMSATTAQPQISFDIDISGATHSDSDAPYTINLGSLNVQGVTTVTNRIWVEFETNLNNGGELFVRDQYNGLYSSSKSATLTSADANLASVSGYGIVEASSSETYLGPMLAETRFNQGGDIVGGLHNYSYSELLYTTSANPIYEGLISLYVKGRADESTPASEDYTDTITFTAGGAY